MGPCEGLMVSSFDIVEKVPDFRILGLLLPNQMEHKLEQLEAGVS